MKLDATPNASLDFTQMLNCATKQSDYKSILEIVHKLLQQDFLNNKQNFRDISDDISVKEKINQINTYFVDRKNQKDQFIIFTNDHFVIAYNTINIEHLIYMFDKMVLTKQGLRPTKLYHLNPNVLNELHPIEGSNPHEQMDINLKLDHFFKDSKYGFLNRFIYSIRLIKEAHHKMKSINIDSGDVFDSLFEFERHNCYYAISETVNNRVILNKTKDLFRMNQNALGKELDPELTKALRKSQENLLKTMDDLGYKPEKNE